MRRLRRRRRSSSARSAAARLPRLRAALVLPLRRSDRLARRAVPRVLRPPPRVRLGPCSGRVRRGAFGCSCARGRSEACGRSLPWLPTRVADALCRLRRARRSRSSRRIARAASSAGTIRPSGSRASSASAGRCRCTPLLGRTRASLAAARAVTRRPPAQRRRRVRPCRAESPPRVGARRRRLHERLDGERRGCAPPQGPARDGSR